MTEGKEFEDGSIIMGSPARAVRALDSQQKQGLVNSAQMYVLNARRFKAGLKRIS